MDDPVASPTELAESFRDIEAANRWLGGFRAVLRGVLRDDMVEILDVGTGSADMPRELVRAARRRGRDVRVTCTDIHLSMLDIAKARNGDPQLSFALADARSLPYAPRSYDAAMCNLSLHHFDPETAVAVLRELRRVSRVTPVVTDLRRSRVAWALAWMLARLFSRNRLTRHDAPMSVLRSYTPREAAQLARAAGWRHPRVRRVPFFRMLLTDG